MLSHRRHHQPLWLLLWCRCRPPATDELVNEARSRRRRRRRRRSFSAYLTFSLRLRRRSVLSVAALCGRRLSV